MRAKPYVAPNVAASAWPPDWDSGTTSSTTTSISSPPPRRPARMARSAASREWHRRPGRPQPARRRRRVGRRRNSCGATSPRGAMAPRRPSPPAVLQPDPDGQGHRRRERRGLISSGYGSEGHTHGEPLGDVVQGDRKDQQDAPLPGGRKPLGLGGRGEWVQVRQEPVRRPGARPRRAGSLDP